MIVSTLIPSFYPAVIYGGSIFASLNNARAMTSIGHKVYVSTTNTNMTSKLDVATGRYIEMYHHLFVKYYDETIIDKLSLPLIFNLWKDFKKADVVHVQAIFNAPIPIGLLYARIMNKPVLLTPHGVLGKWVMSNGSRLKKIWLQLFIRPFAKYVHWQATSEQEKKEILHHFPFAKIFVIPNAIDLKEFNFPGSLSKNQYLQKFAKVSGSPEKIFVSMGRLQKKKGFDVLIETFSRIEKKIPQSYLLIAGEDEGEKETLLSLIERLNLKERVYLVGNLQGQDKVDFLANADLFILPSHNENFGMVYAEALACGTPIIASKETPWEEVEKFGCGRWVENTVEANESAILQMINKGITDEKNKAREFVKRFSFENVAHQFSETLNKISKQNA